MNRFCLCVAVSVAAIGINQPLMAAGVKPLFQSPVVTTRTPGHAVEVKADLNGASDLYLVVTDGGNGYGCDWADWVNPRLVGPEGELKLTDLKWESAKTDWGAVHRNKNANGEPQIVNGKLVDYGIGVHANSVVHYKVPAGYKTFLATGGLDHGGVRQSGGEASSVQFLVFNQAPPKAATAGGAEAGREPENALDGLEVHEGLEATVFAAEPLLLSPTNIDVDHLGRVWVCEVVNYRGRNGERPEGDRILILEDTDQDGQADKKTVFYQGREIDTALGICVVGNQVIVSVAPNVFIFTDDDGDGKADRKELLFSKVGQPQHDHSTHAFTVGPDGKFYWCVGNTGKAVHDKDGNVIVDKLGNPVVDNGKPYFGGMVFRCNRDGSDFEVLGHNFRNNYEVSVDSFGTLWQSDNDDDGNRGVRINYVMEYGNYGYRDEITGAGWRSARTGMHDDIPLRHWHLRDPGVVPNLLQTGQGSPTGITVYEGRLLPEVFWDQVIHCDAGPNVVRAYPVENQGAGYSARTENILEGVVDKWFRPSDVCVAPDGSLIVADWYDPGVGGHRMGDTERGRIFRIAPPGTPYKIPELDLSTVAGAIEGLKNPNLATRQLAWDALYKMGGKAIPQLKAMFATDENPRLRARAMWLIGAIEGPRSGVIRKATSDDNPNLRIAGLRLVRIQGGDVTRVIQKLASDPDPQVRRACLEALHGGDIPQRPQLWTELAQQYDGEDRWYLEALGIAAAGDWDRCLKEYTEKVGDQWDTKAGRDIVWRSRAARTPMLIGKLLQSSRTPEDEIARYLRAFDFLAEDSKSETLMALAIDSSIKNPERKSLVASESLARLKNVDLSNPEYKEALNQILDESKGTEQFIMLVEKFQMKDRFADVLELACAKPDDTVGVSAIRSLLKAKEYKLIQTALDSEDEKKVEACVNVLKNSGDGGAVGLLMAIVRNPQRPAELRKMSVQGAAQAKHGADMLVEMVRKNEVDDELKPAFALALHGARFRDTKAAANELFPLPPSKDNKPLPAISELISRKGDSSRGKEIFGSVGTCAKCHVIDGRGKEVGPNLSEIGGKLSRQALFESILYPSAGISHNYENYLVILDNGTTADGVIVSQDEESVSLKGADAIVRTFKKAEVDEMAKQKISLMPADLVKILSVEELVDVVEYLTTLKKKAAVPAAAGN